MMQDCSLVRCLPFSFIDRRSRPILFRRTGAGDYEKLLQMYHRYEPKESYQGLPPLNPEKRVEWVRSMADNGFNIAGFSFENEPVCHGAIFGIDERRSEFVLAVSPAYQSAGIGTALTRLIKRASHELGFEQIWLCVEPFNTKAKHIYSKLGFCFLVHDLNAEMEMGVELKVDPRLRHPVREIMTGDVVSITPDRTVAEAVGLFVGERGVSGLPVINARRELVGFVSETDVLENRTRDCTIYDIMTREVTCVSQETPIQEILDLICTKRIKQIPVVDAEKVLVGIATRKDIIRHVFGDEIARGPGGAPGAYRGRPANGER